ncbi:MAG: phage portal protein [Gammaproteobacteria bacterium HGW-Gammaproteobacteria-11]|nr:MAG: phage portal protein [Gammaproteobacteria bacterium HGW-Gammaproteobacteria-11]
MAIFNTLRRSERRSASVVPQDMWRSVLGGGTASGMNVTPDLAMKLTTAYACVSHLADSIAMLPLNLYQDNSDDGKKNAEYAKNHPLYNLIKHRPNRWQTSFEWRRMMAGHMLFRGNGYSRIVSQVRGVDELVPMHPDRVLPFQGEDGEIYYYYTPLRGAPVTLLQEEVHHWRAFGGDLLAAPSPIRLHAETIGLALAALEHGARVFSNGAVSTGLLKHPKTLSDPAYNRLRDSFAEKYVGLANHHKPMLLEEGMDFVKLTMSADEVQMLQTRVHQVSEVCSIWRMNPMLIGHGDKTSTWGTGVEQITIGHLTFTLSPLLRMIEQAMQRDLLGQRDLDSGHYLRFTDNALLRVDMKTKAEYFKAAIGGNNGPGWMDRNEVRALEDLNHRDGLDAFVDPAAYKSQPKGGDV